MGEFIVQNGGVAVNATAYGAPQFPSLKQAVPGVYSVYTGSDRGFIYQNKYKSFKAEFGVTNNFVPHGVTPNGYITGSKYGTLQQGGGSIGFAYNPITKHYVEIPRSTFTQCWGGDSKGRFIIETDAFEDEYLGAFPYIYDSNTKEYIYMGQGFRPQVLLENGTVYGHNGTLFRWTKERGKEEIFDPRMNGIIVESATQSGRVFGFGLGAGGSTSRDAGAFIFENEKITKLIDLVPQFDKNIVEIAGGHQTPGGVIFVSVSNKQTRHFTSYRLDPVPEPASLAVLAFGLAALRRRKPAGA